MPYDRNSRNALAMNPADPKVGRSDPDRKAIWAIGIAFAVAAAYFTAVESPDRVFNQTLSPSQLDHPSSPRIFH